MSLPLLIQTATSTTNSPSGGPSLTIGAGHLVVLMIVIGNSTEQHPASFGDGLGNTYIKAGHVFNQNTFSGAALEIWYAFNVKPGAASFSGSGFASGGFTLWFVSEYRGTGAADPLDTVNTQTGNTTPLIPLSLAQPSELVVASFLPVNNSPAWIWTDLIDETGGSGSTLGEIRPGNFSWGDFQPLTYGSYNVTGYGGGSGQLAGIAAAFKVAPGRTYSVPKRRKAASVGGIPPARAYTFNVAAVKLI